MFSLGEIVFFNPEMMGEYYCKRGYFDSPGIGAVGLVMDDHIFDATRWNVFFPSLGRIMAIHKLDLQKVDT